MVVVNALQNGIGLLGNIHHLRQCSGNKAIGIKLADKFHFDIGAKLGGACHIAAGAGCQHHIGNIRHKQEGAYLGELLFCTTDG